MLRAVVLVCLLTAATPGVLAQVALEEVFTSASFGTLTDVRSDGEGRVYVAEQAGEIRVFEASPQGGDELGVYLDIRDRVGETTAEGGILSFAFHPDYATNGYVFVKYVAVGPRRTVISRFSRSSDAPPVADPASEEVLLEVGQPMFNHNGGGLAFGLNGYLYIALGDGGNSAAHAPNGQDLTTLLGSVLRIDVDQPDPGLPYGIPADNPFAATDGPERDEAFAWGFRSPWRLSVDPVTGDVWVGDVGQNSFEEVDRVVLGGNYGWAVMEGFHCYDPPTGCSQDEFELPEWEYDRTDGRSVTGGYVYRGTALPELVGSYVYGDFISGRIWALSIDPETGDATNTELLDTDTFISSFGVDAEGELFVLDYFGTVYQVVRATVDAEPGATPDRSAELRLVGPNPVRSRTAVAFRSSGAVRIAVYDVLGREVAVLHDGPAGRNEVRVSFDAEGLAPGVYIVRMAGANGQVAVPLTLVR